jgi:hypothetical protein
MKKMMKNMLKTMMITAALVAAVATPALASSYWVVLRDGARYEAKSKWSVVNGKAVVNLVNGSVLSLDPNSIDSAKSEEMTRLGGGSLLGVEQIPVTSTTKASTLGSTIRLRQISPPAGAAQAPTTTDAMPAAGPGIGKDVLSKFERAFENVGIFEHNLVSTGPHSLRADLTADAEDKVFNTLSATSFLMVRNAGIPGVQIDSVDLFMKTTNGAAAGRFHLTRDEAQAMESKTITPQSYFVLKVLF